MQKTYKKNTGFSYFFIALKSHFMKLLEKLIVTQPIETFPAVCEHKGLIWCIHSACQKSSS
jgi:hypothetical protein